MSIVNTDLTNKFTDLQETIWDAVKTAATNAGIEIVFSPQPVVHTFAADLTAEFASPNVVVRPTSEAGAFSNQAIILSSETAAALAAATDVTNPEDICTLAKPVLQTIFNGLASAFSTITGTNVAFQIADPVLQTFNPASEFNQANEIAKVQVSAVRNGIESTITWLISESALRVLLLPFPEQTTFESTNSNQHKQSEPDLDILLDIPLEISVELGKASLFVQDILNLGAGSIIQLERAAGEPVDVLVNGRLVARGEVVVIDENFGIRLTEIVTPRERVANLGEVA